MTDQRLGGVIAAATISRKAVNQDACRIVRHAVQPLKAAIVADGLGSHYGSDVGARIATSSVADGLAGLVGIELDLPCLAAQAAEALNRHVDDERESLPTDLDWEKAFGTTLICAVETPSEIAIAYVGNGAAFHIRGDFNTFPSSQLLPWTTLNYLNPHSRPLAGRNVLYKFIAPRTTPLQSTPTVIRVSKDELLMGDIVMICTDGIYSWDQTPIGKDAEGRIWISGEAALPRFFEILATFFAGECQTDEALQGCLQSYLTRLDADDLVSDDCTLAVLVSEEALRYQARRLEEAMT